MTYENTFTFLTRHVEILCSSYFHWTGKSFFDEGITYENAVETLFVAPFAVLSHGIGIDPIFNYGNQRALDIFEMSWEEFTVLPSRLSAEKVNQKERVKLLDAVSRHGYINNYSGIRISKSGRRFMIRDATVWNLMAPDGQFYGQAALIRDWEYL
ncbi:MAG: MEKHLA domain-containing protein [Candidatus Nitrotoga sp. SPKER]|nr:MAG: MEKHLA domain-containing protein [Candidatus Nitrotoga sp. SPKER]